MKNYLKTIDRFLYGFFATTSLRYLFILTLTRSLKGGGVLR
jgi:hypothetical protein